MQDPSPALRELIEKSGLSVSQVAVNAGIPDRPLRRWYYGHSAKLNFVTAGLVFFALTGKPLIVAAGKPGRKGKAAA